MIPLTPESTYQHTEADPPPQLAAGADPAGADSLRDVQRFLRHLYSPRSRADFKKIPLEFLAVVTVDAPFLWFGFEAWFFDRPAGRWVSVELEREELRTDARALKAAKAAGDAKKVKFLAGRIRWRWSRLVDHAEAYGFPDDGVALFEFAPDQVPS